MTPLMMPEPSLFTSGFQNSTRTTMSTTPPSYNAPSEQGSRMNDLQQQLTNLQQQITANMTPVNVMTTRINYLETENRSMKESIEQLKSENEQLKNQLASSYLSKETKYFRIAFWSADKDNDGFISIDEFG